MLTESSEVLQLWRACHVGNTQRVEELIEDGVDYRCKDRNGETVLHMAARADNPEVLEILLDSMPDPDTLNHNHQTPLHLAASRGHGKVVKILLQAGCDPDLQTKYSSMTALHLACQSDQAEVVALLLEGGANCCVSDSIGKLADFYATSVHILKQFDDHLPTCAHGRGKRITATTQGNVHAKEKATNGTDHSASNSSDEEPATNSQTSQDSTLGQTAEEHRKKNWRAGVHKAKKLKINHGLGFSKEHKAHMQMNVFDRLMGKK